ncbi:hypothetical protein HAX54_053381 [Datura stramonium]|uniref:DUF4283 domain-containing protein n=1 Tax=Datura stramonium TaxID=4076 RepID=A0ABS8WPK0_DATST|nr:hypothetical protein [Datura stramonium]
MEHCEVSLLGKVIADKQVNVLRVRNTMNLIWESPVRLKVSLVGKNLFQFVFRHKDDMKKVLYGTPWLYDKILGHIERSCVIREDDVQKDAIKRDQFGVWMRVENHGFAEGTGSNEFNYNDEGTEVHRQNGSKENSPSFTPHEFFKKLSKGDIIKGDNSGGHNATAATQGEGQVTGKNLQHSNGVEAWSMKIMQKLRRK